ncbi:MAG: hypothetical protein JWN72_2546 [Thermoleophilia bacterium]|nr:hypothetical protein [Thermoleophilia bacterium]
MPRESTAGCGLAGRAMFGRGEFGPVWGAEMTYASGETGQTRATGQAGEAGEAVGEPCARR